MLQTVYYDESTKICALNISMVPLLISIEWCMNILNEFTGFVKIFQSLKYFTQLRKYIRTSYVFHPLIFTLINMISPITNMNIISIILHLIIYLTINFTICSYINKVEKKMINTLNLFFKIKN